MSKLSPTPWRALKRLPISHRPDGYAIDLMYGGWYLQISRVELGIFWPRIFRNLNHGSYGIEGKTIAILHLRPRWCWRYAAALQVLGFGLGFSIDHIENPFRKATPEQSEADAKASRENVFSDRGIAS